MSIYNKCNELEVGLAKEIIEVNNNKNRDIGILNIAEVTYLNLIIISC